MGNTNSNRIENKQNEIKEEKEKELYKKIERNTDKSLLISILLIGDVGVGKSNMILRYCDNSFHDGYISTIGVDFKIKTVKEINEEKLKLQIWDTIDLHECFSGRFKKYLVQNKVGFLICFDITDRLTFQNLRSWIVEIERYQTIELKPIKILIGCKSDLEDKRQVTKEEAEELASVLNIEYYEVSSKENINIDFVFQRISDLIYEEDLKYSD